MRTRVNLIITLLVLVIIGQAYSLFIDISSHILEGQRRQELDAALEKCLLFGATEAVIVDGLPWCMGGDKKAVPLELLIEGSK